MCTCTCTCALVLLCVFSPALTHDEPKSRVYFNHCLQCILHGVAHHRSVIILKPIKVYPDQDKAVQ